MKKIALILLSVICITVFSCDNKTENEIAAIGASLNKGHDEVMPKTMMIADLKKNLLAAAENQPDSVKNKALDISMNLQKAEDDMYQWMDNYGKAMNINDNKDEKIKLYKELDTQVKSLKDLTLKSMDDAKAFIGQYAHESSKK
jgi:hypothetical protein